MKRFLSVISYLLVGILLSLLLLKLFPDNVLPLVGISRIQPATETAQPDDTTVKVLPEIALDQAYGKLIAKLKDEQGFTLDHYSLSYMITTSQQSVGLLREIADSEADPDIKRIASDLMEQRKTESEQLLLAQKLLGHSHH